MKPDWRPRPGERIRCVRNSGSNTYYSVGKTYRVVEVSADPLSSCTRIINNLGWMWWVVIDNFAPVLEWDA